jgi:excisionase family DNA binding protein
VINPADDPTLLILKALMPRPMYEEALDKMPHLALHWLKAYIAAGRSACRRTKRRRPGEVAENASNNLTVTQAAALLGVSAKLVYKMFDSGKLQGHRVGSRVVIYRDSVGAVIAAGRNSPPTDASVGPQAGSTEGRQAGAEPAPKKRRHTRVTREAVGFVHLQP